MNTRLLRRIQKTILAEPRRVDMGDWVTSLAAVSLRKRPPCGTVACIAGWAVALSTKARGQALLADSRHQYYFAVGLRELNLAYGQAERLFYVGNWPIALYLRLHKAPAGGKRYAQIVSERIDLFIATKGAE